MKNSTPWSAHIRHFHFRTCGTKIKFEVDPVRINAIIDAFVRLDPIAIDITWIWLFVQKLPSM